MYSVGGRVLHLIEIRSGCACRARVLAVVRGCEVTMSMLCSAMLRELLGVSKMRTIVSSAIGKQR